MGTVTVSRDRTDALMERSVRSLVAEQLGVGRDDLFDDLSLRDDLAADSLDLLDLATALETEFAIVLPDRVVDGMHTYRDVVRTIGRVVHAARAAEQPPPDPAPRFRASVLPAAGGTRGRIVRTGQLTPYMAETLADDARRAGPQARLVVTVADGTARGMAFVRRRFARLARRGVRASILPATVPTDEPSRAASRRSRAARTSGSAGVPLL